MQLPRRSSISCTFHAASDFICEVEQYAAELLSSLLMLQVMLKKNLAGNRPAIREAQDTHRGLVFALSASAFEMHEVAARRRPPRRPEPVIAPAWTPLREQLWGWHACFEPFYRKPSRRRVVVAPSPSRVLALLVPSAQTVTSPDLNQRRVRI